MKSHFLEDDNRQLENETKSKQNHLTVKLLDRAKDDYMARNNDKKQKRKWHQVIINIIVKLLCVIKIFLKSN